MCLWVTSSNWWQISGNTVCGTTRTHHRPLALGEQRGKLFLEFGVGLSDLGVDMVKRIESGLGRIHLGDLQRVEE